MTQDHKGFAARWSKRKVTNRKGKDPEETAKTPVETELANVTQNPSPEGMLSEEDFADVDFDSLDKDSDYERFTAANVPALIQRKAFRKLWSSDPVFEVMDGMNDYDEDFTGTGLAGKALKTAYKVGRGYLTDDDEEDEEKKTASAVQKEGVDLENPDADEITELEPAHGKSGEANKV